MMKLYIKAVLMISLIMLIASCSSSVETTKYDNVEGSLIETGEASWYGPNFDGKPTANGETFNQYELTAAHRTLPFNSMVKVINKSNGKFVIVRINDRGPFAKSRIIDLSRKAAEEIKMISAGHTRVDLILLNNSKLPIDLKKAHYTVQVGSYKTKRDAKRISSTIKNSKVVSAVVNGVQYYRIFVGLFNNKNDAKEQKEYLQNEGIDGFVKQVEN